MRRMKWVGGEEWWAERSACWVLRGSILVFGVFEKWYWAARTTDERGERARRGMYYATETRTHAVFVFFTL